MLRNTVRYTTSHPTSSSLDYRHLHVHPCKHLASFLQHVRPVHVRSDDGAGARSAKILFYYISCGIGAALVQEGVFAIMIHHYASVFQNAGSLTSLLRHLSVTNQELFNIGINPAEP